MRALICLLLITLAVGAFAADLPLQPFSYHEGFEAGAPKVSLWASRGNAPTINFLGPTDEKAFEGKQSLKLDVTYGDSPYYYFGLPVRVPAAGKLKMSARMWVQEVKGHAGFGANVFFPPTTQSGCSTFESYNKPTGEWKLAQADLVEFGEKSAAGVISHYVAGADGKSVGVMLDRWAIFLSGGTPGAHVVVYLDDVRIEGEVPEEKAYLAQATATFDAVQAKFKQQVQAWQQQFAAAAPNVNAAEAFVADAPALVASIKKSHERAQELLGQFAKSNAASPAQVTELKGHLAVLEQGPRNLAIVKAARAAGRKFLVYPRSHAVSAVRRGGIESMLTTTADTALAISACPGEYESVSAMVYALQDVRGMSASCTGLKGKSGSIPASAIDIRLLKSWFQGASNNIGFTPQKWLIPELLLKDDKLVRVDLEKQDNYLRSTGEDGKEEYLLCSGPDSANLANVRPIDAEKLQPVDLAAGETREFWVTVHLPEKLAAGVYEGNLTLTSSAGTASLPVKLTVNPFELQPSRLIYSIYYRGVLSADGKPTIGSEGKSEQQYRAEMDDLKAHGVLYPTNYLGWDEQRLPRLLDLRKAAGMPGGPFYNLGYGVGPRPEAQLPQTQQEVMKWITFLKPYGYTDVYFYGTDEATGEALISQKATWKAVQQAGGKTFVAGYKGTFEAMGSLLNTAVLAGPPDPEEAKKWHSVGSQAFCYANPQVGVEDPTVYRRNFGLVLWKAGFDGAMDYAYQHAFHHVWNDFDDRTYRDHNFTYPTVSGVIPTIAWEGFREAVDDVRYVTTLEKAIKQAKPARAAVAKQAQAWLDALDPSSADPDETREEMVQWITKLR
ncbi:MAG: hypothetical protein ABFE08_02350 [Armatimonadia bacterium]